MVFLQVWDHVLEHVGDEAVRATSWEHGRLRKAVSLRMSTQHLAVCERSAGLLWS